MSRIVTYSPAYTLVPTSQCFNRCSYCNFRIDPGKNSWLTLTEAKARLENQQDRGVLEILILSGEVHPQSRFRNNWFQRICDLCELALSVGFLPHTNAGPLSFEEMSRLREVNVSMGLMLEQLTPQLLQGVHRQSPSKVPGVRLQQLEWAGKLQIPFTTGLLVGIGETEVDWQVSLEAIALVHSQWGHIQEVIIQPYSPGDRQSWDAPGFNRDRLPEVIATARQILPSDITLQIPPNLIDKPDLLLACLNAGARDLGGIGPTDEVNPNYPHIRRQTLANLLESAGWQLVPRLPIYPQYDSWLVPRLQTPVRTRRTALSTGKLGI